MAKRATSSITMEAVAKYCGLSKATISRAINSPEKLTPETREKVEQTFQTLGYRYNPLAAFLSKQRSRIIGVIVGNIRENTYALTLGDIQEYASRCHLDVMFSISDFQSEKEEDILHSFLQYKMASVIVLGPGVHCHEHLTRILGESIPHLVLWESYPDSQINYLGLDSKTGMAEAVAHLAQFGHRNIGLGMSIHTHLRRAGTRINAFEQAMRSCGLPYSGDNLALLDDSRPLPFSALIRGKQIMEKFLARPHVPTAIIYPTGGMAEGGIITLRERGIDFPGEMSILCLGDDDVSSHFWPRLTALDSRLPEICRQTRKFIRSLAQGTPLRLQHSLPTRLILRDSCVAPRTADVRCCRHP